jgi:hypothetical protein
MPELHPETLLFYQAIIAYVRRTHLLLPTKITIELDHNPQEFISVTIPSLLPERIPDPVIIKDAIIPNGDIHSADYRSFRWPWPCPQEEGSPESAVLYFSQTQAAAVKLLFEASKTKHRALSGQYILEAIDSDSKTLSELFKHTNGWGTLIQPERKPDGTIIRGLYYLSLLPVALPVSELNPVAS